MQQQSVARPKADLPQSGALLALISEKGELHIRATARARSESITIDGDRVLVKVRAKPNDGEANVAIEKLVARALELAPSRCRIIRGASAREKTVKLDLS